MPAQNLSRRGFLKEGTQGGLDCLFGPGKGATTTRKERTFNRQSATLCSKEGEKVLSSHYSATGAFPGRENLDPKERGGGEGWPYDVARKRENEESTK